jgi:hypothetical protein
MTYKVKATIIAVFPFFFIGLICTLVYIHLLMLCTIWASVVVAVAVCREPVNHVCRVSTQHERGIPIAVKEATEDQYEMAAVSYPRELHD